MSEIAPDDARLALDDIEQRRRQIAAQIDVPARYWWAVAGGWILLGLINETGNVIAGLAATIAFGAVHAALAPRLLTGRHGSPHLSVRSDVAGRHLAAQLLAGLVVMVVVTIVVALLADAAGASHPATIASIIVAAIILVGGPRIVAGARRRAVRGAER